MKYLIFTDEEIDGDGEEEKVPSFESIVNGEDEDEEAWIVILIWCFALIKISDFLFKLHGFVLKLRFGPFVFF